MTRIILLPIFGLLVAMIQTVGNQGTCSHGDSGTLLLATLLSFPLLLSVLGFSLSTLRTKNASLSIKELFAYAVVLLAMTWLLLDNFELLQNIVWYGYNACGSDQGPRSREDVTIAVAFGFLPLVTSLIACFVLGKIVVNLHRIKHH